MIGVIADDLTGAAEIGAVGWRHGLRAEILLAGGDGNSPFRVRAAASAQLLCLNTDSRSSSPATAAKLAAAAAKALASAGAEWIYKKTDSVLRGPVAAELEGILKQLDRKLALLLPANPSLGRTIRGGHYYIHGRPIDETEFARDPEHPRRSSDVLKLPGKSRATPIRVCSLRDPLPASGIVIGEVETPEQLRQWAKRRSPHLLPAGGAEFFGALLRATGHAEVKRTARRSSTAGNELFVCGSTSESSRRFVEDNRARGIPVFSLSPDPAPHGDLKADVRDFVRNLTAAIRLHRRVIMNIGLPLLLTKTGAARLANHLAQLAATVLRRTTVSRIYAEGGATAMELVREAGWKRLKVAREVAPGVATLAIHGKDFLLTIKPGSYIWPDEIRAG